MKFLYKPVGLVFGVLGGMVAGALFKRFWRVVADEEQAPKPWTSNAPGARSSSRPRCTEPSSAP